MMRQAVEQGRGHLGVAEHRRPLAEAQVGGDDNTGAFVEFAQQVEQQGAPRSAERQVALDRLRRSSVQDDEVGVSQTAGDLAAAPLILLLLQRVDQVDG